VNVKNERMVRESSAAAVASEINETREYLS